MAETTNTTATETVKNTAENTGGDSKGNADNAAAVSTSAEGQTEKTFTQKELDDIVRQRLERQKKDMPSKEELKAFKEWKDSQKTAEELSAEKISAAEKAQAEAERLLCVSEAKCAALSRGVSAEAVEDVIALAMARTDENTTIDKAIGEVIAKYPSFCTAKNEAQAGITTGVSFGAKNGSQPSGVEAAFLAKNPDLKI